MKLYQKVLIKLSKIMLVVICLLITLFLVFTVNGFVEYGLVNSQIDDFKERGQWVCDIDNYHFYEVEKKYDYENTSLRTYSHKVFNPHTLFPDNYIGSKGDIIITSRNPMRGTSIGWIIGIFSKYYYVGHATINLENYKKCYESEGKEDGGVHECLNDWMIIDDCPTLLGLRVKTDEETIDKALNYIENQDGKGYNWTFVAFRNKTYYCTDLISRAFRYNGVDINYDKLATTGNDMILSDNTYIFFYKERIDCGSIYEYNVYYLKDDVL